jgi:drug/metabolite transporter (DMT)-like permease
MKNYLFLVIGVFFLSTMGVLIKLIGGSIHFMNLNFYREFFGFLTLLIICPFLDKNIFRVTKKDLFEFMVIGLLFAVASSLSNVAFLFAPVQNVSLITSLAPIFVFIFSYYFLREKITTVKVLAVIVAIVGLAIINPLQSEGFLGNILSLIVAGLDGLLATLLRKVNRSHAIGDVMWFLFFATVFLLPFQFFYGFGSISIYVALLGVISTGLAYLFISLGYQKVEAQIGSILTLILNPVVSISLAAIILKEVLQTRVIIGGVILLLSATLLNLNKEKLHHFVRFFKHF